MCNFVKDRTNLGRGWGNGENEGTLQRLPQAPSFYSLKFPHHSILFFISLNEINIKNKYNIHKYVY